MLNISNQARDYNQLSWAWNLSCSLKVKMQVLAFNMYWHVLLIRFKMPTIVGILTFISTINTTSERLKAWNFCICLHFSFYEQLTFHAQLSLAWKMFHNLRPRSYPYSPFVQKTPIFSDINASEYRNFDLRPLKIQSKYVRVQRSGVDTIKYHIRPRIPMGKLQTHS